MKLEKKERPTRICQKVGSRFFFFFIKKKKKRKKEIPTDRPDLKICALEGNTTYFFLS